MKPDQTEIAFDAFVRADGQRLRRAMTSQYGVDIGCESTDAAMAWAWEHWDRLRPMANPACYLYRVAQTQSRRAISRGRPVTFPNEPSRATEPVEDGVVTVTVDPPAVPTPLQMDVTVSQSAGIIGVTGIKGSTNFETASTGDVPSLTVLDGLPSSAVSVQIRFKKGDDVWFLSADPTVGNVIPLAVPDAETDRFADEPVDWVLFTMLDANGRVVDVGGGIV